MCLLQHSILFIIKRLAIFLKSEYSVFKAVTCSLLAWFSASTVTVQETLVLKRKPIHRSKLNIHDVVLRKTRFLKNKCHPDTTIGQIIIDRRKVNKAI